MPTMPWRFYRYMLFDVLRQFAITSVILVVVIAFGAAIKPLTSDRVLMGFDTLKYLGLAIVPMLQFALPFAAAFAATIGIHRLAQDNEIIAMSVSGQSYMKLLLPMVFFGLVLTIIVSILTQAVIPTFVGKMADAITADIPRLLTYSIKQHTPFVQGNLIIWAEDIYLNTDNDDERMVMDHVAVSKLDSNGKAIMYFTATTAIVDIQRNDDQTSLHVAMQDVAQWTSGEDGAGILRGAKEGRMTHAIDLPTLSKHSPSYSTRSELMHLRDHPEDYPPVASAMANLRSNLLRKAYLTAVRKLFSLNHVLECTSPTGGRKFIIEATALEGAGFVQPVKVTMVRATGETSVLAPAKARFLVEQTESGDVESVTFQMTDVIIGEGQIGENQRAELVVPNLKIEQIEVKELDATTISELFAAASNIKTKRVKQSVKNLRASLEAMELQIISKIAQRWAVSAIPLLVVILGSLLAIRFFDKLPLGVYARVFIPSVLALLLVFTGGQMIIDSKIFSGYCMMWSGNAVVAGLAIYHWLRLRVT